MRVKRSHCDYVQYPSNPKNSQEFALSSVAVSFVATRPMLIGSIGVTSLWPTTRGSFVLRRRRLASHLQISRMYDISHVRTASKRSRCTCEVECPRK
jgi:hypothetical protein